MCPPARSSVLPEVLFEGPSRRLLASVSAHRHGLRMLSPGSRAPLHWRAEAPGAGMSALNQKQELVSTCCSRVHFASNPHWPAKECLSGDRRCHPFRDRKQTPAASRLDPVPRECSRSHTLVQGLCDAPPSLSSAGRVTKHRMKVSCLLRDRDAAARGWGRVGALLLWLPCPHPGEF